MAPPCFRIVVLVVTLAAAAATSSTASAEPPARARVEMGTRASVRRLMIDGDFEAARTVLDRLLVVSDSAEARAAELELGFVLDVWSTGTRPTSRSSDVVRDIADPDVETAWEFAFIAAREVLLRGAFAEAARRFDVLVAHASNVVMAIRASELRVLAREALAVDVAKRNAPATPSIQPAAAPPPRREKETTSRWYGAQTLIVDGAAVVTAPFVPLLGLGTYLLGAPIVHLVHGRPLPALASLGARVGLPITFGLVVPALLNDECPSLGCFGEVVVGGVVGIVLAVTLDAAVLARETVPVPAQAKPAERKSTFRPLSAGLVPRREGGFVVGVGAAF